MKISTSTLTGSALDWAVSLITNPDWGHDDRLINVEGYDEDTYQPSTDWSQAGPIIEQERIRLDPDIASLDWEACPDHGMNDEAIQYGPTPLIAAMRCYVASKLGDEVEIPDELC